MLTHPKRPPFFSQEYLSWVIPLTQEVIALVDADIAERLGVHAWQAHGRTGIWYAARGVHGRPNNEWRQMHREIMSVSADMEVDHRHHQQFALKTIDNRRDNLRVCTTMQNMRNQRKKRDTVSPYKGVSKHTQSAGWIAAIRSEGQFHYLGYFSSDLEGALAYDKAAREMFGEFAATNESLGLLPTSYCPATAR